MKSTGLRISKRVAIPPCQTCQSASPAPRFRHLHSTALRSLYTAGQHVTRPVAALGHAAREGPIASPLARRFASAQAASAASTSQAAAAAASTSPASSESVGSIESIESELAKIEQNYRKLMTSRHVLSEESIVGFMKECEQLVALAMSAKSATASGAASSGATGTQGTNAHHSHGAVTSSLLDLDSEKGPVRNQPRRPEPLKVSRPALQVRVVSRVSPMLNSLLRDSKVFISEEVLRLYTELQCDMRQAEHFPEVFKLFATKPIPMQQSKQSKQPASSPSPTTSAKAVTTDIKYTRTPRTPLNPPSPRPSQTAHSTSPSNNATSTSPS
ncbi:ATP synthase complex assembly protein atp12 [Ascosphaera pollenicola]|nr:ATP synthase complex assembly protein atp12 [Ascosphaera pollenicola]